MCNFQQSSNTNSENPTLYSITMREFSEDEEKLIARMFKLVGKRWHLIAGRIPGRTAAEIEMYWTTKHSS
ncbi:hypothetical protein AQUCO_00500061v1 [Aquilegia coerulea]|uniref:Uncharacterized protein n=1 Tax=Aquilegia coerulea TaxID=218851 RepID=A0A2G5EQ63_AQUCA|nr:hypothetical protein AQUCO_00500061v1 [Aquilegia coerulea]